MSYASLSGRARTSSRNPQAHAICDRCGGRFNHVDLKWQNEWRGPILANIRILVCSRCLDTPQENLRTITLPADPVPIMNARVQDFDAAETDYRTTSGQLTPLLTDSGIALTDDSGNPIMVMVGTITDPITGIPIPSTTLRTTEDCQNRVIEPYGAPVGLTQAAVMPYNGATQQAFGVPLSILSVISNGTATVQVTCSKVHGLQQNNQISVQGLKNPNADGFFSVAVLGATSFTYMCYGSIPADSLLEPTTRIVTALVGIPRGFATIPQVTGPALTGAAAPTPEDLVELESDEGWIQLEDGTGSIELEDGP